MSCIRFNTDAQREQLKYAADADAIAQWLSPELTDSKLDRIRVMAKDRRAKIRESAALAVNIPDDVALLLVNDKSSEVRACLARNENVPCDVLRVLGRDKSATVRAWVAVNFFAPQDTMELLADDNDEQVRKLVLWKSSLKG